MKEHINIFTGSSILTNRLAFLLDNENIPTLIKDQKESGRLAGFGAIENSSELFIYSSDFEKSKIIINNFKKEIEK